MSHDDRFDSIAGTCGGEYAKIHIFRVLSTGELYRACQMCFSTQKLFPDPDIKVIA